MKFTPEQRELKKRAIATLMNAGWALVDAAQVVGYAKGTAGRFSLGRRASNAARTQRMVEMYREGKTLSEVGVEFNVTRERVRQLIAKAGVSKAEGGIAQKKKTSETAYRNATDLRRNQQAQRAYGCDYATAKRLNGNEPFSRAKTRARQFVQQRRSARARNIGWELTLAEWCRVWEESGKFHLRGRGRGHYCMARERDSGPYAVGNVQIITNEANIAEGWDTSPPAARGMRATPELRARQLRVYELRVSGLSHAEIGAQLGISAKSSLQWCVVGKRLAAREAA